MPSVHIINYTICSLSFSNTRVIFQSIFFDDPRIYYLTLFYHFFTLYASLFLVFLLFLIFLFPAEDKQIFILYIFILFRSQLFTRKRGEALLAAPPAAAIFLKYFLFIIIMHLLCSVKYNYSSEIIYLLYQLYSFANSFLKFFSHIHIFCILRHTSFCGAIHGSSVLCSANLLSGGKYYDTFKMFRTQLLL